MEKQKQYVMITAEDKGGVQYHSAHIFQSPEERRSFVERLKLNGWKNVQVTAS